MGPGAAAQSINKVLTSCDILLAAKNLYEACTYDQQCSIRNPKAFCLELSNKQTQCSCPTGYHAEKAHEIPIRYECNLGKYNFISLLIDPDYAEYMLRNYFKLLGPYLTF